MRSAKRDLAARLRGWPTTSYLTNSTNNRDAARPADAEADNPGFVAHLVVDVPDLHGALAVAERLCVYLVGAFPQVVAGVTTVSRADHQSVRHHVFCDRLLPDQVGRCGLRHQHRGECTSR
jgi:hypothetical protein